MKKYITPVIECYEIELTQIVAQSNVEFGEGSANTNYDGGGDARENHNNTPNVWNNGW